MTASQIIFLLTAFVAVFAAVGVVTSRNMVHAALWLIATLFGAAVLYALLEASFIAVVQVVVYIGAIAIMFIFAVMLTRRDIRDRGPQHNPGWIGAAVLSVITFGGLVVLLTNWSGFGVRDAAAVPADSLNLLGKALVSPDAFVLPFEVASVLLLAALVGAVYVAIGKKN
jgi:NADH-quinone oxidoreductase subunit J